MIRRIRGGLAVLGLLSVTGIACGDGGSGPSPSSLVGTWQATTIEIASVANPSVKLDGLSEGDTFTLELRADYTWVSLQTTPGEPDMAVSGTWSLGGSTLVMTAEGESVNFQVIRSGNSMTLTTTTTWDFDLDGTEEPARMTMVFVQ